MNGRDCRGRLSLAHPGRATANRDLWQQLRSGGGDRLLWTTIWITKSNQRTSELISVGTAPIHRRDRDPTGLEGKRSTRAIRVSHGCSESRKPVCISLRESADSVVQRSEVGPANRLVKSEGLAVILINLVNPVQQIFRVEFLHENRPPQIPTRVIDCSPGT